MLRACRFYLCCAAPSRAALSRPLSAPMITQALLQLPGWSANSNHRCGIRKEFVFRDFNEALAFMNTVGKTCEDMAHHPTWCNTYNRVAVELNTHDAGNQVTDLDLQLAAVMNDVFETLKKGSSGVTA